MFGLFGGVKKLLKGYKITAIDRKQKYGIAADSLKMLKDKASAKLKVKVVCNIKINIRYEMLFFSAKLKHVNSISRLTTVVCIWRKMVRKFRMKRILKRLNRKHYL